MLIEDYTTNEAEVYKEMKKSAIEDKKASLTSDVSLEETCMLALQTEKGWYMTESKYLKTIRTMAWILRFVNNCRTSRTARTTNELSAKEFQQNL